MRMDSLGLFWEDLPKVRSRNTGDRPRRPMPNIPHTGWRPPSEFPNLSAARVIALDTETKDPGLRASGPGWGRGSGHLIGVSLAVEGGASWYFPMRHESQTEFNLDPEQVLRYLRHTLQDSRPKVGANLVYDVGWLLQEGVEVGGRLYDVQFAEALLDSEAPSVDLDSLAHKYLQRGKETNILYDWLAMWLGGAATERQRQNLWLSPPSLAGPYAEADAALPLTILERQWPRLVARGVADLFDIECRLIPLLVRMRMKGAPVNVSKAEEVYEKLGAELQVVEQRLSAVAGRPVNPNARDSMLSAFRHLGLEPPVKVDPKTKQQKVSFDAPRLETIEHPIAELLLEYRRITKVRDVFIKSYILDKNVNGRIHCSFHPLRNNESGARSGRFSSSDPNLQNIPVRTDIGKMVRDCFEASGIWKKADYSQIEYRMLAHHAVGEGSEELRAIYNSDPDIDYHELTTQLVFRLTGIKLPRRNIKNINFGLIYGMAEPKLATMLGLSLQEGKSLFADYHAAAPYARATMDAASLEVHSKGYVETILGRKSDFNRWGPKRYSPGEADRSYEAAVDRWGVYNIERSRTHKALNRKLQGGAADIMKKAMVLSYEAGLFTEDACGIPLLTVHDELDFDDLNDPNGPWWGEFKRVMEQATPDMRVPVLMDISSGPSWGRAD